MNLERFYKECNKFIEGSIEYCKSNYVKEYKESPIRIEFSIRDDMAIGGTSKYHNEEYSIEINKGVFKKIYEILNVLLYEANDVFYKQISLDLKGEYDYEKANSYFDVLFELSVKNIIFHELGHIYNGHLRYISNAKDKNELSINSEDDENNKLDSLLYKTLEMDADAFAATNVIGQITFQDNIDKINRDNKQLIKGKEHAYFIYFIITVILFAMMGSGEKKYEYDDKNTKYLPLRTRLDCILRCSLNAFYYFNREQEKNREWLNVELFRGYYGNIEEHVNLFYRDVEGIPEGIYSNSNNINELSPEMLGLIDKLNQFWNDELRDNLKQYSYINLAK